MPREKEFIVWVSHDTEHGIGTNVCLITDDFDKALRTCRKVEELGYILESKEACASVHCLESEKAYRKTDFSSHKTHPLIFMRENVKGQWKEVWIKRSYQR